MRSLVRYSLIALGLMALAITVAVFRPRLEQKAMAQIPTGCNPAVAPNKTDPDNPNRCLVISSFRENGPAGTGDEYVELFNASIVGVNVSDLSSDPQGTANGIGVFASAGNGCAQNIGGGCTGAANASTLVCQIPGTVNIPGRGYYLCVGTAYSLNNLGINGGSTHSSCLVADRPVSCQLIGSGNATGNNIPDDAGLALLDIGTQIIDACDIGGFQCNTGFQYSGGVRPNAIVYDKVGFDPYQQGAPAPGYPTFADQYCETKCLAPVGDVSVTTAGQLQGTCPASVSQAGATFPTVQHSTLLNGVARCYGESGQYKIERRRAASSFTPNPNAGDIHRDTQNNADDFILLTPNPSSFNVGVAITGNGGVTSVLGAAGPHTRKSPPIVGQGIYTGAAFDLNNANQLGASNAERRYNLDPNFANPSNNPQGTFILRIRFTNNSNATVTGGRFRVDDISGLCGNQSGVYATGAGAGNPHVPPPTTVAGATALPATQEARNLRLPIFPALTPVPNCQGEGSDAGGAFTAILKAVNMNAEHVSQGSDGTLFFVNGSSIEDIAIAPGGAGANLSPLGGGGDNALVINSQMPSNAIGDGVSGGPGTFAFTQPATGSTTSSTRVLRVGFRFGVVRAGRFKVLLGREMAGPSPVN